MRLGTTDIGALPSLGIRNDAVSSIKVAPGYEIIVYADGGFNGNRATYSSNVACLSQGMNDVLSSFEIRAKSKCYQCNIDTKTII